MKTCNDVMTQNPVYCLPGDMVVKAAELMKTGNIGPVLVVEDEQTRKLVGIVTDRDLALKIVAEGLDDINLKYLLTVNLFLMTPHLGELFELRVVRQDNQVEIGRVSVPAVLVSDFTIYIPQFELNQGYNIDFYADHNGNGIYDPPPTDHAWRLTFNSSTGDFIQDFTHNTNFTDIQWPNPSGVNENEFSGLNDYHLYQNYPNPCNPSTKISFNIPAREFVTLKVYNVLGSEVAILINDNMEAGLHDVTFNASGLNSGVYFYVINTTSFTSTRKMILLK